MPVPPGITAFEALRQAARLAPAEVRLLTVGGRVPLLLYDLNKDGQPECFAVAVRDRALKPAQLEALSQSSRLFDAGAQAVSFVLLVYANAQGSLRKPTVLELGPRRVFEALTRTPLTAGRAVPLAVTVSFLNPDGREQELLVFDGAGGTPRYRRSLVESLSVRSWLEDVDADGTLDILTRERAVEEGVGYETFLTWSRWNGRAFADVQTRNVLRDLAGFLGSVRELLLAGDRRRLAELAAEAREMARLRGKGLSEAEALAAAAGTEGRRLEGAAQAHRGGLPADPGGPLHRPRRGRGCISSSPTASWTRTASRTCPPPGCTCCATPSVSGSSPSGRPQH